MHDHAANRTHHPGTQFQQPFTDGPDLSSGTASVRGLQTYLLHQDVCGCGQQNAELVSPEVAATGAVDLKIVQFFYPILYFAALAVDLFVEPLRTLLHVGDDKAGIVFRLLSFGPHDLCLDDDATLSRPGLGRIVGFAVDVLGLAALPREPAGLPHAGFGLALQYRVFGHGNDVLEVGLGIQKVEQLGMREAAVEANPDTRTRKAVGDHIDQTTQDSLGSDGSGHIAGTQHRGAQILFSFIIEAYKSHDWQVAPAVVVSVEKR